MSTVDLQPVLSGKLLTLRPLREDDFDALFDVACDPLLWEQHPANDRWQEDVFRAFFRHALDGKGALVAIDAATRCMIGSSRYHAYSAERDEVEIGWTFLARSHWGGTHNREMKYLMLSHAFGFVDNVIFHVGTTNWRSQRAVEKIGATRIGTRPDASGNDSFVYRITRADFANWKGSE